MSRLTCQSGTTGTVTVPAGSVAVKVMAIAPTGSSASFVVTPAGNAAWPSIGLPAASPWFELTLLPEQDDLGPTSTITFTGTASFVVLTDHTGGV